MNEKKWSVEIVIDEHDADEGGSRTRAQARLRTRDTHTLVGVGLARRNPADTEIPEIGDELADVLYCLVRLADRYGIDLEAAHVAARARELAYLQRPAGE